MSGARDQQTDVLSLAPATRKVDLLGASGDFLDFKIGRRQLSDLIKIGDRISILGWLPKKLEQQYARQLLLRSPSDFASGRVPLYLCAECGDLGCGALTVHVSRQADQVIWSDFRHEAPGVEGSPVTPVRELQVFVFDWEQYRLVLWPFS